MRIGIIRDISQINRKTPAAAKAEAKYQSDVVEHIEDALEDRYDVIEYVFDDDIVSKLEEDEIDLVFNLANGKDDIDDRSELPTLLNVAGIPYTGSNAIGHGISDDKALTAEILKRNEIPHPKTDVADSLVSLAKIDANYPVIVKPNREGSSRGITDASFVRDTEELFEVARKLFKYTDEIVLSEYIDGKEVTVSVIGNGEEKEVLPIVEVDFSNVGKRPKIFTFEIKHKDLVDYHVPANLTKNEKKAVEETARRVYDLLQIRDYARIDMRIKDGKAYVLEVNALAGLHPDTSDIVKAAKEAGMDYDELIQKIVEIAMAREGLVDDGKKDDVDDIRKKRREENKEAHQRALATFRERVARETKEKIDDFEEETKRRGRAYKADAKQKAYDWGRRADEAMDDFEDKASEWYDRADDSLDEFGEEAKRRGRAYKADAKQKAYDWGHRADEAMDDFEEGAKRRGRAYKDKASEWYSKAEEAIDEFGEEAKRKSDAYQADAKQRAYVWGREADEAMDNFEEEARRRGQAYREDARHKASEWYDEAEDLRDELDEDARAWDERNLHGGYRGPGRYSRPVDDARYAALERRIHALEERIRLLENKK